jgi:hypothetical protein
MAEQMYANAKKNPESISPEDFQQLEDKVFELRDKHLEQYSDSVFEDMHKWGKQALTESLEYVQNHPWVPKDDDKFGQFMFELGQGAASLTSALIVSILTKSPSAAAVMFGAYQSGSVYHEAREKGSSINEAYGSAIVSGMAEAALEKLGLDFMLKRFPGMNKMLQMGVKAASEALQEGSQTLSENTIAKLGYDTERDLMEGVGRSALMGAILGAGAETVLGKFMGDTKISEAEKKKLLAKTESMMNVINKHKDVVLMDAAQDKNLIKEIEAELKKQGYSFEAQDYLDIKQELATRREQDTLGKPEIGITETGHEIPGEETKVSPPLPEMQIPTQEETVSGRNKFDTSETSPDLKVEAPLVSLSTEQLEKINKAIPKKDISKGNLELDKRKLKTPVKEIVSQYVPKEEQTKVEKNINEQINKIIPKTGVKKVEAEALQQEIKEIIQDEINKENAPLSSEEKQNLIEVYHGTNANIESPTMQYTKGQIGIHFGTNKEQAKSIFGETLPKKIIKGTLNIKNPLRLEDLGGWQGPHIVKMVNEKIGSSLDPSASSRRIREVIQKAGYDSIVYENKFEGEGKSYIIFNESQFIPTNKQEGAGEISSEEKQDIVYYRGGETGNFITNDPEFAKEYGTVKQVKIPKNLELLDTNTSEAEQIAEEISPDTDSEDIWYNPDKKTKETLKKHGYDGFINNDKNIFISDSKNITVTQEQEGAGETSPVNVTEGRGGFDFSETGPTEAETVSSTNAFPWDKARKEKQEIKKEQQQKQEKERLEDYPKEEGIEEKHTLSKRVYLATVARDIQTGLTPENLSGYTKADMLSNAERAIDYVNNNYQKAVDILMYGGEAADAQGHILKGGIFNAVKHIATKSGDVRTLYDLALNSHVAKEATFLGQQIKAFDEMGQYDAISAIRKLGQYKKEAASHRIKDLDSAKQKEVENIKSFMGIDIAKLRKKLKSVFRNKDIYC